MLGVSTWVWGFGFVASVTVAGAVRNARCTAEGLSKFTSNCGFGLRVLGFRASGSGVYSLRCRD